MKIDLSKIHDIDLNELGKEYIRGPLKPHGERTWGYREDAFFGEAGNEHYKLLAYFSTLFNNKTFIDIGTFRGYSALALSYNKTNKVISYDPHEHMYQDALWKIPSNVEFKNKNILNSDEDRNLLLSSPLIFLDADHHGIFEKAVNDFLIINDYKGMMLCDDINFDGSAGMNMIDWWESIETEENKKWWNKEIIKLKKHDLTKYGHGTLFMGKPCGTGLLDYSGQYDISTKVGETI